MSNEVYHFKIGTFKCMAVSDGTLTYGPPVFPPPATLLFSNATRAQLDQTLNQHNIQPDSWTEWKSPYICLLIDTGDQLVLVDTGANGLDPNTGRLLQNLEAEGIQPKDIDMVIITHCHPDHIGGNTLDNGELTFPNARYTMWKKEWDFWTSKQAEEQLDEHLRDMLLSVVRKNLPPIQERLNLIKREEEILPGIRAIEAGGHTPGHMALSISSEGEQLLCIADTVLHPIHLEHPEWCAVVDFNPDQVLATRHRILTRAADENALVLAYHFPFPGLGHVVENEEAWQWHPIEN